MGIFFKVQGDRSHERYKLQRVITKHMELTIRKFLLAHRNEQSQNLLPSIVESE